MTMAGVEERKKLLLEDPDVLIAEPHRVFCNRCEKWLKLDEVKLYAASVWRCHKNTKSHNARSPNKSAPAPQLPDDDKLIDRSSHKSSRAPTPVFLTVPDKGENSRRAPSAGGVSSRDQTGPHNTDNIPSASASDWRPRLTIMVPRPAKGQTTTTSDSQSGVVPSETHSSMTPNGTALASTPSHLSGLSKPSDTSAQSVTTSRPGSMQSDTPQRSMPPPASASQTQKVTSRLPSQADPSPLADQTPGLSQSSKSSKHFSRLRSISLSGKDGEATSSAGTPGSRSQALSPDRVPPHRMISYKALRAEPYIGTLEPFRAFCTICKKWVDLSTRTPYSYGIWKGHVRKSEKHRFRTTNAEDDYETASEHSQEESGPPPVSELLSNVTASIEESVLDGASHTSTLVSRFENVATTKEVQDSNPQGDVVIKESLEPNGDVPPLPFPGKLTEFNDSSTPNPFTLKATTEDSFAPRPSVGESDSKEPQISLLEGDDIHLLTESSDDQPPVQRPLQKPSAIAALARRRQTMLDDPDAAIVESRRVQCGICDRWIKGSNTQEYSLHHWLKHKKKCARAKGIQTERWSEPAESRKSRLEADPDLLKLEPHRALCGLCNKFVKLCGRSRFSASHWLQHKRKCLAITTKAELKAQLEQYASDPDKGASKVAALANTARSRCNALLQDPNILEVWPDRVQCRACKRWIKLSSSVEYSPSHWTNHKDSCPEKEIAAANIEQHERMKVFEDDPLVSDVEPHRIRCAACHTWVKLKQDYHLPDWQDHKKTCKNSSIIGGRKFDEEMDKHVGEDIYALPDDEDREAMDVEESLKVSTGPSASKPARPSNISADQYDAIEMASDQSNVPYEGREETERRRLKLLKDPKTVEVESYRVRCRKCENWIPLEDTGLYMIKNWDKHKKTCYFQTKPVDGPPAPRYRTATRQAKQAAVAASALAASRPIRPLPKAKGKVTGPKRGPSPLTLPPLPQRPRWPSEDERKQQFVNDPDVLRIEPHRLLCKNCHCWIRLHPIIRYSQSVWPRHKENCKEVQLSIPGDAKVRAKSEKEDARRLMLEDDPYASDISPHRVTCKACGTNIRLDTTYKYEGSHWRAHRARCGRIPFQERLPKKRKSESSRRASAATVAESPNMQHVSIMTDSSDSDSEESSAARPHPTSFFTAPLEINPMEMFKRRPRAPSVSSPATIAWKAMVEAYPLTRLPQIAQTELNATRYASIIQSAGDGVTSEELLAAKKLKLNAQESGDEDNTQTDKSNLNKQSPTPAPEMWIPRKRTREEIAEFDQFFVARPLPTLPTSKGKLRVCGLEKDALPVID